MNLLLNEPLISIVITVYNTERYLKKCLDSVIGQTYRNLEIICVDDGSTDNSGKILDEYAKLDKRILIIHQKNRGMVNARKTGVNLASGMIVGQVDSDDWILPDMYEKMVHLLLETGAEVVCSGLCKEYSDHQINMYNSIPAGVYEGDSIKEIIVPQMIYSGKFYCQGVLQSIVNKVYLTDFLRKYQNIVSDEIRIGEDAAVIYPLVYHANRVVLSNECYYHQIVRPNSSVGVSLDTDFSALKILYCYLLKNTGKELEYGISRLILYMSMLILPNVIFTDNIISKILPMVDKKSKIVLYGGGKFGKAIYNSIRDRTNIIKWVDKIPNEYGVGSIFELVDIEENQYDYVLLGTCNKAIEQDMRSILAEIGIFHRKIVSIDADTLTEQDVKEIYNLR